jgi:hypothetical protein
MRVSPSYRLARFVQQRNDSFEPAFEEPFGSSPPDELNTDLQLTIIATELGASSERICCRLPACLEVDSKTMIVALCEGISSRGRGRRWVVRPATVPGRSGSAVARTFRAGPCNSDLRAWLGWLGGGGTSE